MVVATAIKDYIANIYGSGTIHINGVMRFNEDCALHSLRTPLPSGFTHESLCTSQVLDWAYNNIGYTPSAVPGKVGVIEIVEATGVLIGVLHPPHTIPAEAVKGSTACFGITVTTEPKTPQAGESYAPIQVKAKVRIIHSSLTPEFSGESVSTPLSIGGVATLDVAITIPTTAKTGNYNVYAEAFTLT